MQLHGHSGATVDVDVTIAVDERNEQRVAAALDALRAAPHLVGERGTAYRTRFGQLEVMRTRHGVGDYQAWMRRAELDDLGDGLSVMVGSPSDLLASKEAAGRDKDLAALPRVGAELVAAGALRPDEVRGPITELDIAPPADPAAIELLGERPDNAVARALWEHGADVLRDYRKRWRLLDDPRPLGPPAERGRPRRRRASAAAHAPPARPGRGDRARIGETDLDLERAHDAGPEIEL